jgi:hypothetical protein
VALPSAGTYRVEIEYWPRVLTPALWVALVGLVSVAVGAGCLLWPARRQSARIAPVNAAPAPGNLSPSVRVREEAASGSCAGV